MGVVDGKVVVVTGAARGQGRADAVRFAEEGADVIAMDICRDVETVAYPGATPEELRETVAAVEATGRRIIATETDVRDVAAVREAVDAGVEELGRLDFVIANAGITSMIKAEEMDEQSWSAVINTNLTGVWGACRAVMPHLIEQGEGGSMVLIASSATYVGLANLSHYSAAKGGVVGLMQSLAVELGPHMIRVNTIHPTTVRTPMALNQSIFDLFLPGAGLSPGSAENENAAAEAFKGLNSMPIPWIEPEDIANAALYLCSDAGRYVSGTQLRVDAGSGVK
jgi:SDR family mycofactocin-dependent oxidoreductase